VEKVSFEPGCDDIYGEVTRVVGCLTLNASLLLQYFYPG